MSEPRFPSPFKTDEDYKIRQAWTDIIIKCWKEGDDNYIKLLREKPEEQLKVNPKIAESEGKYFPLPSEPPDELKGLSEADLEKRLNELLKPFGQMMMCGGWVSNEPETWSKILARAWTHPEFLQRLRDNPTKALTQEYPNLDNSSGRFFPISKERHPDLQNVQSEDELRKKLNSDEPGYFGWMTMCCG